MKKIKNITIIPNLKKSKVEKQIPGIIKFLENKGASVFFEQKIAATLNKKNYGHSLQFLKQKSDMILVLGGDGTFLYAAGLFYKESIPTMGINFGNVGFLNEVQFNSYKKILSRIIAGEGKIEKRMMLQAKINKKNYHCLNEIAIARGTLSRILHLDLLINNTFVSTYRADGIIFATPTGSTAYSLSAHGPIVLPSLDLIIINPICPHGLGTRPFLANPDVTIQLKIGIDDEEKAYLTLDGRKGIPLSHKTTIEVAKSQYEIPLIITQNYNFYELLSKKFEWTR